MSKLFVLTGNETATKQNSKCKMNRIVIPKMLCQPFFFSLSHFKKRRLKENRRQESEGGKKESGKKKRKHKQNTAR